MERGFLFCKLKKLGISGKLLKFLESFLSNRTMQVRIGSVLSSIRKLINGVPQGSVLSPLLFLIMINDLIVTDPKVKSAIFADDSTFWAAGKNIKSIEKTMQKSILQVSDWCDKWGFKISLEKSVTMLFTRKTKNTDINLRLKNTVLNQVTKMKYLGVVFDSRNSWKEQISHLQERCSKPMNILKCLAGKNWGAARSILVILYKVLIRSILDYGALCYSNASKTQLQKLNVIQNKALRICTGALRSTPTDLLEAYCGVEPLGIRRKKLFIRRSVSVKIDENNLLKEFFRECIDDNIKHDKNCPKCFGFLDSFEKEFSQYSPFWQIPWWTLPAVEIDLELANRCSKKKLQEYENKALALEHMENNNEWLQVYTDGSKAEDKTACGFCIPKFSIEQSYNLPDYTTIFTAELYAIYKALLWIGENNDYPTIIYTDSKSVCETLMSGHAKCPNLLNKTMYLYSKLVADDAQIIIRWIPSHVGIKGNELADATAKAGLYGDFQTEVIPLEKHEVFNFIDKYTDDLWTDEWYKGKTGGTFRGNFATPKVAAYKDYSNRRKEVTLARLRFEHALLNKNLFLFGKHQTGLCDICGVPETVRHYLYECLKHQDAQIECAIKMNNMNITPMYENLLYSESCTPILLEYVTNTKRLL